MFVTLTAPRRTIKRALHLHTSEMTFSRERSTMRTERVTDRSGIMADCEQQKKDVEEF